MARKPRTKGLIKRLLGRLVNDMGYEIEEVGSQIFIKGARGRRLTEREVDLLKGDLFRGGVESTQFPDGSIKVEK